MIENVGRSQEELQAAIAEEISRVTLEALQLSEVPGAIGDYIRGLGDIDKLGGQDLTAALAKIQKAMTEKQALDAKWFDLTATAEEKLAKARKDELAALDDTNRALAKRIYALQDEREAQAKAASALERAISKASEAAQKAIDAAAESSRFRFDLTSSIRAYVGRLEATPAGGGSPLSQLLGAKEQYASIRGLARRGSRTALEDITGIADQLIAAQRAYTGNDTTTMRVIESIKADLLKLPAVMSDAEYIAEAVKNSANKTDSVIRGVGKASDDVLRAQIVQLGTKFTEIDLNTDGLLSFSELKTALGPLASNETIRALIKTVDKNGDGMISQIEVETAWTKQVRNATANAGAKIWDGLWGTAGLLSQKFDILDSNVDGLLDFKELKAALGPLANDKTIRALIQKADKNHDGEISMQEAIQASIRETGMRQVAAIAATTKPNVKPADVVKAGTATSWPAGWWGPAGSTTAQNWWEDPAWSWALVNGRWPDYGLPTPPMSVLKQYETPSYASGGMHMGGLRMVGERGPELEVTGPARYYSAEQTSRMMRGGGDDALLRRVDTLTEEVRTLTAVAARGARGTINELQGLGRNAAASARATALRASKAEV